MLGKCNHPDSPDSPCSLAAVLSSVAILSTCGGAAVTGMAFITRVAYNYSDERNLYLQLIAGVVYVAAALLIGPIVRMVKKRGIHLSRRSALSLLLIFWGAGYIIAGLLHSDAGFLLGYCLSAIASGASWPLIEAFLSGGRSGKNLRETIGRFNITWSSAMPLGIWGLGLVIEFAPLLAMTVLGFIVFTALFPVSRFTPEPPAHLEGHYAFDPVYRPLLASLRAMLPLSVLLVFVINPIAPTLAENVGLSTRQGVLLISAMHVFRVFTFIVMRKWHGWHGRWRTPVVSTTLLFGGFAAVLLGRHWLVMFLGLSAFGTALGAIYYAALYYALTIGKSEVEAGGLHEALIGCGFFLGPIVALVPVWTGVPEEQRIRVTLWVCLFVCAFGLWWAVRPALAWFRQPAGNATG